MEETTAVTPEVSTPETSQPEPVKAPEPDIEAIVAQEIRKAMEKMHQEPEQKPQAPQSDLTQERDQALAKVAAMEKTMLAMEKGIPADKAARYVKLAETYMEGDDFAKALDIALTDFPIEKKGSVPGGANPGGASAKAENYGATLAKRKLERQKKSNETLKQF